MFNLLMCALLCIHLAPPPSVQAAGSSSASTQTAKSPDLVPVDLVVPTPVEGRQRVSLSWTVANNGTAPARSHVDRLYLSADTTFGNNDALLGDVVIGDQLAAGARYTRSSTVTMPNLASGNYYVLVRADASVQVSESNENNNQRAATVRLSRAAPDLMVSTLSAPRSVRGNDQVTASWTVTNDGLEVANSHYDVLYLSTDALWSANDRTLSQVKVATNTNAGANYTQSATFTMPNIATGEYYILARTDTFGNVVESDETNNIRATLVTLNRRFPDLSASQLVVPATMRGYDKLDVSWTVVNQGDETAGVHFDAVFISPDPVLSANDQRLTRLLISNATAPGGRYTRTERVDVPNLNTGTYYVIVRADMYANVSESNGQNNERQVRVSLTRSPSRTPTASPSATATRPAQQTPTSTATLPVATDVPTPSATVRPATVTATNTPVPTATRTATATNTPVPTAMATNTPVPTATNTPVPTVTRTATATNTPIPTATATSTATNTPVPTATATATSTATNTPVPTATATSTATNTPVPTARATNTPMPTATATNTPVPTATATNTATNTAVPTATNTPAPTNTSAPTNTPTVRPTTPGELPPDPTAVAPTPVPDTSSDIATNTEFLYSGSNPIQTGVLSSTIEITRVAVLRGEVQTQDGAPLSGVRITIDGKPELGQTLSRADGMFDLAVNGGGLVTVSLDKDGYLPVQRQIEAPERDFAWLPTVAMSALSPAVTTIEVNANEMQVAEGSVVTDTDGTRQSTLLIPERMAAVMELPDGTTQQLSSLDVRTTEYTVGEDGKEAMPGPLPSNSGYTYAVEFSVDEAMDAGATNVRFNKPLINYVENFIGFPVGSPVPAGYYDREKEAWIASENGLIVKILRIVNGSAVLDVHGLGADATSAELTALGVTPDELLYLGGRYPAGTELWRVPITHFTPWDYNWPYGPPDDAEGPDEGPDDNDDDWGPCNRGGSIIECENQILREKIDVVGTDFSLYYGSDRVPGRQIANTLDIPVSGATVPASLRAINVEVQVAGQRWTRSFAPTPNQTYTYVWDGKDGYGRAVQGKQEAVVRISYTYGLVYQAPANFARSFGRFGTGVPLSANRSTASVDLSREYRRTLGTLNAFNTLSQGIGGWTLDAQHIYDPDGQTLLLGDGTWQNAGTTQMGMSVITTLAGGGQGMAGDNSPAISSPLNYPADVARGPDGALYLADTGNNRIRRIGTDGTITTVAGTGEYGYDGDGGPAVQATVNGPSGIAFGSDGALYFTDTSNNAVRKIDLDGIITTVAYGPIIYFPTVLKDDPKRSAPQPLADETPTPEPEETPEPEQPNAGLMYPQDVAIGPDGDVYVADTGNDRIVRIEDDGTATLVAGADMCYDWQGCWSGDNGPAVDAYLYRPSSIAFSADGTLYIADSGNNLVRRVDTRGTITTIAGIPGENNEQVNTSLAVEPRGLATEASLDTPVGVIVAADGALLVADSGNSRVIRVTSDGNYTQFAGNGESGYRGDGGQATDAMLRTPSGLLADADGTVIISDLSDHRIRRVNPAGIIATIAGTGRGGYGREGTTGTSSFLSEPQDVASGPDGSLYIADTQNNRIRRLTPDGTITTVVGTGVAGFFGDGGNATDAQLDEPTTVVVAPDGTLYIGDNGNLRVRRVTPNGTITTVAGTGSSGHTGDDALATDATFESLADLALSKDGSLFIADSEAHRVRLIAPDGVISTVAGDTDCEYQWYYCEYGDNGPAKDAALYNPNGVAVGSDGTLYISDYNHYAIRSVGVDGIITTLVGRGGNGNDGVPASQASVYAPQSVAVGPDGSVYYLEGTRDRVRQVSTNNIVRTVAGKDNLPNVPQRVKPPTPQTLSEDSTPKLKALWDFPWLMDIDDEGGPATAPYLGDVQGLTIATDGAVIFGAGDRIRKVAPAMPDFGIGDTLLPAADGKHIFQFNTNGRHIRTLDAMTNDVILSFAYNAAGQVVRVTDRNGLQTTIERDSAGRPTAIVAPYGQRTTFQTNAAGYLTRVTNPAGEATALGYGAGGLLTSLADARNGQHTFQYDTQGRLILDQNPVGGSTRLQRTSTSTGYTVLATNALNHTDTFIVNNLESGEQQRVRIAPNGARTTTLFNPDGTTAITRPDGTITRVTQAPDPRWGMTAPYMRYMTVEDANGEVFATLIATRTVELARPGDMLSMRSWTETTSLNGKTTSTTFDVASRTTTVTDLAGKNTATTLDTRSRVIREETDDMAPTTYRYDARGRMVEITEGSGAGARTTVRTFDNAGNLQSSTDPLSGTVRMTFDSAQRELTRTLPTGQVLQFTYDAAGNRTSSVDGQGVLTTYEYDLQNRKIAQTLDPDGRAVRMEWVYDRADNVLEQIEDAGSGRINATVRTAYTPIDTAGVYAPRTVTDALGHTTTYTYTLFGKPARISDPLGRTTAIGYTPQGWPAQMTSAGGLVARTEYNNDGKIVREVDPRGGTTTYEYDFAGRVASVTTGTEAIGGAPALNQTTTYTYDVNSRIVAMTDGEGRTTRNTFDAYGRMIRSSDGLSNTTTMVYDANDNVVRRVVGANVAAEAEETAYTYDAIGRLLTERQDPNGLNLLTQYRYTRTPSRDTWNLQQVVDPRGNVTLHTYNTLGQQASTTDANNQTWQYSYDNLQRKTAQTDALGRTTTYGVDAIGRTIAESRDGQTERWTFNADGTKAGFVDFAGRQTAYQYDRDRRLVGINYPDTTPDVTYTYDGASNVVAMTDGLGTTEYTFDVLNRLTSRERNGRAVSYAYNAADEVTTLDYWGQGSVAYDYDDAGRMTSLGPWGQTATTYDHRTTGKLATLTRGNGVETAMDYDGAGRLTALLHSRGAATVQNIVYDLDRSGNRTAMRDGDGESRFSYDAVNRIMSVAYPTISGGPSASSESYGYDAVGNRTTVNNIALHAYNERDQITNQGYTYDANGNLLNDGQVAYRYDAANRLIETTKDGVVTTYGYDGWGNLVEQTVGGVTTEFVLDERTDTPVILAELGSDGSELRYAYDEMGASVQQRGTNGTRQSPEYLLTDGLKSVRLISNAAGAVVGNTRYDAWGGQRYTTGAATSTLGFTGERQSVADGTVFLRARYYQPTVGRFLQRDTFRGDQERPQSLNRYIYAEDNPTNWIDPTGHSIWDWVQGGLDVVGLIPGVGEIADGVNGLISLARGDCVGAALSFAAMVPFAGWGATAAKAARNGARYADEVADAARQLCSFDARTPVRTPEGDKPIAQIAVGDRVLAFNETTGTTGAYTVTATWAHEDPIIETLTIDGEEVETTPNHPFFTEERGWVVAGELLVGDHIRTAEGGTGAVEAMRFREQPQAMYNMTVALAHTYFVGDGEWLVHNARCKVTYDKPPTGKRPSGYDEGVRDDVLSRNDGKCVHCGRDADTIDHREPWNDIKQGAKNRGEEIDRFNDTTNHDPACRSCNSSKGTNPAPNPNRPGRR